MEERNNWDEFFRVVLQCVGILFLIGGIRFGIEEYVKQGRWDMRAYESIESYEPVFYKKYKTKELCDADGEKFLADKLYVSFQCSKNCKYVSDSKGEYAICD